MATETTSAKAWAPDVQGFVPSDVIPDAIVLQVSTVAGRIEGDEPVLRVPYVSDADASFTPEGEEIDEAGPTLSEAVVATSKITQLVRLSREQYSQTGTAGLLSDSVRRAIIVNANQEFLTQVAPTPPAVQPPAGVSRTSPAPRPVARSRPTWTGWSTFSGRHASSYSAVGWSRNFTRLARDVPNWSPYRANFAPLRVGGQGFGTGLRPSRPGVQRASSRRGGLTKLTTERLAHGRERIDHSVALRLAAHSEA